MRGHLHCTGSGISLGNCSVSHKGPQGPRAVGHFQIRSLLSEFRVKDPLIYHKLFSEVSGQQILASWRRNNSLMVLPSLKLQQTACKIGILRGGNGIFFFKVSPLLLLVTHRTFCLGKKKEIKCDMSRNLLSNNERVKGTNTITREKSSVSYSIF